MTMACKMQTVLFQMGILWRKTLFFFQFFAENEGASVLPYEAEKKAQSCQRAERLLNEYGNSLLRMAYAYLHNQSDAEDVLQDTLIQLIKAAPEFESAAHEKAWLMRVTINISKNRIQHKKLRETDELSENLQADEQKDLSFVWEAVKQLQPKYREVVHLFYEEGYATAQIAEILSKNETTVRSLLHRARGRLKEILGEVYDFEESLS